MAPSMRYLIVRALLFLLPFAVLMIAQVEWWLALLVSLAFAFAASIVFFPRLREEAAADLQRMREGRKREGSGPDDADIEDAALHPGEAGHEPNHRSRDEHDDPDAQDDRDASPRA
jgi:hypothetical protein